MAKLKIKKPLKVSSLNNKASDPAVTDTTSVAVEKTELEAAAQTAAVEKEPVKKIVSPLLAEPIDIKEHAMGVGPQNPIQQSGPGDFSSLEVDQDFFSTPPVQEQPKLTKDDLSYVNPNPPKNTFSGTQGAPMPAPAPDVPEQKFNDSPSAATDQMQVPDNVSKQAASETTDMIMDIYKRMLPEVAHNASKINAKEIKKLEESGDLIAGAYNDVIEANKENKKAFEERAKEDAAMIKKPLRKLLEVKNVAAPPHIELLIVLVFVALTQIMMIRDIKKSNDSLLEKLYAKINKDRHGSGAVAQSDIPLAETEEVVNKK